MSDEFNPIFNPMAGLRQEFSFLLPLSPQKDITTAIVKEYIGELFAQRGIGNLNFRVGQSENGIRYPIIPLDKYTRIQFSIFAE